MGFMVCYLFDIFIVFAMVFVILLLLGQINKGDQIMMCEGVKLVDVPLEEAEKVFKKHMTGALDVRF